MWRLKQFLHQDHGGSLEGKCVDVGHLKLQVRSTIAQGGFSCVYLVKEVVSGKSYALKHIICTDSEMLDLVRKEVGVMELLKGHPNIVTIHAQAVFDLGRTKECFLVMDYCERNLVDVLDSRGAGYFEEKQLLLMFREVCNAVYAMHRQTPPIAHRDLKAENLLQGPDNSWKLCDFGSTTTKHKRFEKPDEMGVEEDVIRKHTTPAYRAPEMWDLYQREVISEKVDIWALGCLLFRMAYFASAFTGDSKLQILNGNYRIPDLPHYSDAVTGLIKDMLALSPGARPDILHVWRKVNQYLPTEMQTTEPDKLPKRLKLPPASATSAPEPVIRHPSNSVQPSRGPVVPSRKPPSPPKDVKAVGAQSTGAGSFWSSQFAQSVSGTTAGAASPRTPLSNSERVPVSPQTGGSSDRLPVTPQPGGSSDKVPISPQPRGSSEKTSVGLQPGSSSPRLPMGAQPSSNSPRVSMRPQSGARPPQAVPITSQQEPTLRRGPVGPQFDASPPKMQFSPPFRNRSDVEVDASLSSNMAARLNLFGETTNGGNPLPPLDTRHQGWQADGVKSGDRIQVPFQDSKPTTGRGATSRRTVFPRSSGVSQLGTSRSELPQGVFHGHAREEIKPKASASIWELQEGLAGPVVKDIRPSSQAQVHPVPTDLGSVYNHPAYDVHGRSVQFTGVDPTSVKAKDDFLFQSSQTRFANSERDTGLRRNDLFSSSERFGHRGSLLDRRQDAARRAVASGSGAGWPDQQASLGSANTATFAQTSAGTSSSSFPSVEQHNKRGEGMQARPKFQPAGWAGF
eukprot:TRINITY_DN5994_c0_g1_i1.p1 TRINITY_DN5994_c0_g1~~TRINITY_DN5994_c0_g1_i1.p1  ORF type:complete len:794 (+),score=135.38 TRINITY_DN5994_c0_g1_i1:148-2529(+)